jgi:glycosyltransferase involved in cell wall biosynthesis
MHKSSLVSVVIPSRNEEKFISACLDSIISNGYPTDQIEILVVDGMSEDGTRSVLDDYAHRYPFVRLFDNPQKITPVALNIGIGHAKGDFVLRIDGHACLGKHFISRCVEGLQRYGADNVGGLMKTLPKLSTLTGKAIVCALSHWFGVGNSYFRIHTDRPKWVDTVFGGCYRREVFERFGKFNENLARGQDMEFNLRLKKGGARTLMLPDIESYYYARSDLRSFWKHNWSNGVWAILPFLYSSVTPVSWRHLVPLVFVASLAASLVLGLFVPLFGWLFLAVVVAYTMADLSASAQIAWRERDVRYLLAMPLIFAMLHVGYGLGSLWGVVRLLGTPLFWKKLFGLEVRHGITTG